MQHARVGEKNIHPAPVGPGKKELTLLFGEQPVSTEEKYKSLFENAVEGIFITSPKGHYLDANRALAKIYGFEKIDEMISYFADIGRQLYIEPLRREEFIRSLERDGKVSGFESQVKKKDGTVIWITENARAIYDRTGQVQYYEGTVMDITDKKVAEEDLALQRNYFSQLFSNTPQAIVIVDKNRELVQCNKGFSQLFGFSADDVSKGDLQSFIVPQDNISECNDLWNRVLSGETVECETERRHRDGSLIPVSLTGFPIFTCNEIHGITYVYKDISERKSFEKQIIHQAFHDSLTGLPNRIFFNDRLEKALAASKQNKTGTCAVLLLDLNKFKSINDRLGHPAGDMVLVEAGERLAGCVRPVDTVARLGGDEFAVILEDAVSNKAVIQIANRIYSVLCKPFVVEGTKLAIQASIGILLKISHYDSAENIFRDVDIAMYRAKQQGKPFVFFDQHMHREILESLYFENELRNATAKEEFRLHFQPIVSVAENKLEGFEALLRWQHPTRGMVPPDQFIPLAEETGLIVEIGQWVIAEACRTIKRWCRHTARAADLTISVNVSVRQFKEPGLVKFIQETIDHYEISPQALRIEITETIFMEDADYFTHELGKIRALGVQIALDDFGTGYSSLSYLHKMPIDIIKIDRSFVHNLEEQEENVPIIQSIISMAKILGISVTAEGVENIHQLQKLARLDCNTAQGYFFSKPMDQGTALEYMKKNAQLDFFLIIPDSLHPTPRSSRLKSTRNTG